MEDKNVLNYFKELIVSNSMFHATIVACSNQEQLEKFGDELCRMILCQNNSLENDGCDLCIRYEKSLLLNFLKIGDGVNIIKKEQMNELMSKFSTSTFENSSKKVYLIQNVENLNEGAANSILKFLEEPEKEIFAVLLTNDRSQILPTIKSRCKIVTIKENLTETEIDQELVEVVCQKNATKFLLMAETFKKKEKKVQVDTLNFLYKNEIIKNQPQLAKLFLDVIIEIKSSNYLNLVIENFFIQVYEVLKCE